MEFSEAAGGNEKFSEAGEEFFRVGSNFSGLGRGDSKMGHKNNFENDIDSKVTVVTAYLQ